MRHVAVAIKTTGRDPKQHRIAELAAVEMNDGVVGEILHLQIATDSVAGKSQGRLTFQAALARWTEFIAGRTIVVHDYYEFKRFLRAECARANARFDIARGHPMIDTWLLAKERFPKQKHSLDAVTRKLAIETNLAASDALETARIVARVAIMLMDIRGIHSRSSPAIDEVPASLGEAPALAKPAATPPVSPPQRSLLERLTQCWRVLVGHA